jgi:DNA-binding transcriptional MerR regulator
MVTDPTTKAESAFRTIGELSDELGLPQHILRYWETRFPQLRPLQRAGKRRYYRPDDVALVRRINMLLNEQGYTVRGVQKLLAARGSADLPAAPVSSPPAPTATQQPRPSGALIETLRRVRAELAQTLAEEA